MKIIGIDASLTSTGVACLQEDRQKLFLIKTKPKDFDHPLERYRYIAATVAERCTGEFGGSLDGVHWGIEGYAMYRKLGKLTELAEAGGLIKQFMYSLTGNFPVTVAPTTLKKFITGKGVGRGKEHILLYCYQKWGIAFKSDDTADAFGIAKLVDAVVYRKPSDLYKYERECVDTIINSHPWLKK